jgi:hypothetical protein
LVTLISDEPPADDQDQKRKIKYPFIACEILASEVWEICDAVYRYPKLLDKLYSFVEKEAPLNPTLTSYSW